MPGVLSEQIAALRKERGLTQEQLGKMVGVSSQAVGKWEKGGAPDVELLPVIAEKLGDTIDALFGLEGGEGVDVTGAVCGWLFSFPEGERIDRLCRLVWSVIKSFLPGGVEMPRMDYLSSCRTSKENSGQLMYSQLNMGHGLLLDVHAEDLSFVTLWPEPKEGFAAYFSPMEDYRGLFSLLARPGCLELLEELYRRKPKYFIPEVVSKHLDIPHETVIQFLEEFEKLHILWSMELELKEGEVKAYQLAEPVALVPFLFTAQALMQSGLNYMYLYNDDIPLLRGERWKKHEETNHEKL